LEALVLSSDLPVVGPLVDFERMPFKENGREANPDVPFLSSELNNEPFSDEQMILRKGCHLHWALPSFLTRSTQLSSGQKAVLKITDQESHFPPVPDRWLVRRSSKQLGMACWLIESDCYSTARNPGVVFPLRTDKEHGVKTVFLGRTTRLDPKHPQMPLPVTGEGTGYLGYLTAIGHGDPAFHAFYPNCYSLFGLFDAEVMPSHRGDLRYDVVGWYSNAELDHLGGAIGGLKSPDRLKELRAAAGAPSVTDKSDAALISEEIANRFGLKVDNIQTLPDRLVCFSSTEIIAPSEEARNRKPPSREPAVGIASTATEALAALLSRKIFPDNKEMARKLEEQLEALHLRATLNGQRLDLGSKFREARHARHFTAIRGGTIWGLRPLINAADAKSPQPRFEREVPPSLAEMVERLNNAQSLHDHWAAELERTRSQLYCDWYKYMFTSYPVPGLEIGSVLIDDIVDYVKEIGIRKIRNELEPRRNSAAEDIRRNTPNAARLKEARFQLMERPGPRYWQPNEPVVVMSGYGDATDRHGGFDRTPCKSITVTESTVVDWILKASESVLDKAASSDGEREHPFLLEWEVEIYPVKDGSSLEGYARKFGKDYLSRNFTFDGSDSFDLITGKPVMKSPCLYTGRSILTPNATVKVRMEMETFFRERAPRNRLDAFCDEHKAPPPGTERDSWLAKQWSEFADWYLGISSLAQTMQGAYIKESLDRLEKITAFYDAGDALVLDQVRKVASGPILAEFYADAGINKKDLLAAEEGPAFVNWYRRQLHFIEFLAIYRDEVKEMNQLLSQALSGFNDALLMHRQCYHLPVAEPLGFAEYQNFTADVAAAIGKEHRKMPQPDNSFLPLRAGLLKLHKLHLVDTFGRVLAKLPSPEDANSRGIQVDYPSTWTATDGLCHLPPRLVQPSQLQLRWLSAAHSGSDVQSNDDPATGPICGWLMVNELDNNIAVYAPDGHALGSIDDVEGWSPAPAGGVAEPQIPNPYLKAIVESCKGSVTALLADINDATKDIDPENFEQHQATALLMGRPLAVVRGGARLKTNGPLAIDQSWDELRTDIAEYRTMQQRNRAGLEELQVEVRLGDRQQLNDGLVGWWREKRETNAASVALEKYQHATEKTPVKITLTLNDAKLERFLLLMDPRAKVHAYTGLLPVKSIDIPAIHFSSALQRMEIMFLTAPLITGKDLIDLPLMTLEGKAWSWLEKQDASWSETGTEGILRKDALRNFQGLKEQADAIWDALAMEDCKWIVPEKTDPSRATVVPVDQRKASPPKVDEKLLPLIELILARTHIVAPETQAAFQQENMIREGWLKLRNVPTAHSAEEVRP